VNNRIAARIGGKKRTREEALKDQAMTEGVHARVLELERELAQERRLSSLLRANLGG
jgi:hypothetical protein